MSLVKTITHATYAGVIDYYFGVEQDCPLEISYQNILGWEYNGSIMKRKASPWQREIS